MPAYSVSDVRSPMRSGRPPAWVEAFDAAVVDGKHLVLDGLLHDRFCSSFSSPGSWPEVVPSEIAPVS